MVTRYLLTIGLILGVMLAGIAVRQLYDRFARRHPELGPFRQEGGGCGGCSKGSGCHGSELCSTKH